MSMAGCWQAFTAKGLGITIDEAKQNLSSAWR